MEKSGCSDRNGYFAGDYRRGGLFFFSDQPILTAAALDTVGQGVAASALGVFSFSRFALSAASPIIAGKLFDSVGIESTFFYIAGIYFIATLILVVVPLAVAPQQGGDGD